MNTARQEPLKALVSRSMVKLSAAAVTYSPRVLQVFLNTDMRGGHNALILLGKSHGLDLPALQDSQAVIFINRKRTLMKIYVSGNTFSYTKRDVIDLDVIRHIPKAFGANKSFSYDAALEESLREKLFKKKRIIN